MAKHREVTEARVVVHVPEASRWQKDPDVVARAEQQFVRALLDAHLESRNWNVYIAREYQDYCGHCGFTWEEADGSEADMPKGLPLCCEKAQGEWNAKVEG